MTEVVDAATKQAAKETPIDPEHVALLETVRDKSSAKRAALKLLDKKSVQAKVIRSRCCLFSAGATYTDYFGPTWKEAVARIIAEQHVAKVQRALASADART